MVCQEAQGPIKLFTCVFGDEYNHMLEALRCSIEKNAPDHELVVETIPVPESHRVLPRFIVDNNAKLQVWSRYIRTCGEGTRVVLLDCDTLVLRPLDGAFIDDFDVAYTIRSHRIPFNSGVVFLRVNPRSRLFMYRWSEFDDKIFALGPHAPIYIGEYMGINQRSFANMLQKFFDHRMNGESSHADKALAAKLMALPCPIWNCEQTSYGKFSEETAVLHVKSWLREGLLYNAPDNMLTNADRALFPICREYGY